MSAEECERSCGVASEGERQELKLWVRPDLYRAFQRGLLIMEAETGHSRLELMEEMVRDFLTKHGC